MQFDSAQFISLQGKVTNTLYLIKITKLGVDNKMYKIKAITKGGLFSKKDPLIIPENFLTSLLKDISGIKTYEDLCKYKKKQQLATHLWNLGYTFCVAKTKGAFFNDTIAFVAYDEYEDFPVWIIICSNYNNRIHYTYYDASNDTRKREFIWALPPKINPLDVKPLCHKA